MLIHLTRMNPSRSCVSKAAHPSTSHRCHCHSALKSRPARRCRHRSPAAMLQSWGDTPPPGLDRLALPPQKKRRLRRQTENMSPVTPGIDVEALVERYPRAGLGGEGAGSASGAKAARAETGGLLYSYRSASPSEGGESDEEDPCASPGRAYRGTLYGRLWFTPPDGGSVLESAGFAAGSTLLNVALLLFLIWTRAEPRCADSWLASVTGGVVDSGSGGSGAIVPMPASTPPVLNTDTPPKDAPAPGPHSELEAAEPPLETDLPLHLTLEDLDGPPATKAPSGPSSSQPAAAQPSGDSKPSGVDQASKAAVALAHLSGDEYTQAMMKLQQEQAMQMEKEAKEKGIKRQPQPPPPPPSTPPPAQPSKPTVLVPVPSGVAKAASSSPQEVDAFQRDFNVESDHRFTWSMCPAAFALREGADYATNALLSAPPRRMCPETARCEQVYQLSWFGRHLAPGGVAPAPGAAVQSDLRRYVPRFLDCVHAPPEGYRWPQKHAPLPCHSEGGAVHWPNLRVAKREELVQFNEGTPKNLFHFDAAVYDKDGFAELSLAARHIPLGPKVRLALDLGAGGGSLGLLLGRVYNVTTVATAFADWPYCEYLSERGQLCLLLDSMEPMPFAKGSFDLVHSSWLFHGQRPAELADFMYEADRVLRPGGYLYLRGGWSHAQIAKQRSMLAALGYAVLHEQASSKPADVTKRVEFGPGLPYEADWTVILVKPMRAVKADEAECRVRLQKERSGKLALPLKARPTPTQMGNVFIGAAESKA